MTVIFAIWLAVVAGTCAVVTFMLLREAIQDFGRGYSRFTFKDFLIHTFALLILGTSAGLSIEKILSLFR